MMLLSKYIQKAVLYVFCPRMESKSYFCLVRLGVWFMSECIAELGSCIGWFLFDRLSSQTCNELEKEPLEDQWRNAMVL